MSASLDCSSQVQLPDLLQSCGLARLVPTFEDEELSIGLLQSMSDLRGTLAELGVSAADAARLASALHHISAEPPTRIARPAPVASENIPSLLQRLGHAQYVQVFVDEELTDVALLRSMGPVMLRANLSELGVDDVVANALSVELFPRTDAATGVTRSPQSTRTSSHRPPPRPPQLPPPLSPASLVASQSTPTARHTVLPALYINLAARRDRRTAMEAALPAAGLAAVEHFEAVTGEDVRADEVAYHWDTTLNARFDRNCKVEVALGMSSGERGCAASHVLLWRRCAGSGRPLLVLEDDVTFSTTQVSK